MPGIFGFMQKKIENNGDANLFAVTIERRFDEHLQARKVCFLSFCIKYKEGDKI